MEILGKYKILPEKTKKNCYLSETFLHLSSYKSYTYEQNFPFPLVIW